MGDPTDAPSLVSDIASEEAKRKECAQFETSLAWSNPDIVDGLLNHGGNPEAQQNLDDVHPVNEPEQLIEHDVVALQDLLDMQEYGFPVSWPNGLNQQMALDICETARKRRRLYDG